MEQATLVLAYVSPWHGSCSLRLDDAAHPLRTTRRLLTEEQPVTSPHPATAKPIVIDLYKDWIAILRDSLHAAGYATSTTDELLNVAIKFFNVHLRNISTRPRNVKRAKELTFPPAFHHTIEAIAHKATVGEPLTPHLSKRLLDLNYHDSLLNDWGLHHLHLSTSVGASGFVDRTGPLLFAHVTNGTFHMVTVLEHGSWTNKYLLETLLNNWPELLEPYEMCGVVGLEAPISPADRSKLRKANISMPTQLSNGKVYFPIGGGVTTAGSNVQIVRRHHQCAHILRKIEADVVATLESKRAALPEGSEFGNPPTFRLTFIDGVPAVVETTAMVAYPYPLP
jgi:hypothetical protein